MGDKEKRDRLIEENIKLVAFTIKKYYKNFVRNNSFLKEDLYQEGCIGLIEAASRFDESKGNTFSTYAIYWITGKMNIFITRYYKKHYGNNDLSLDIKYYEDNDCDVKLIDALQYFDYYEDERIKNAFIRAKVTRNKNIYSILTMFAIGYSQKEIGEKLGITNYAVAKTLEQFRTEFKYIEKLCKITNNIKNGYRYVS